MFAVNLKHVIFHVKESFIENSFVEINVAIKIGQPGTTKKSFSYAFLVISQKYNGFDDSLAGQITVNSFLILKSIA